MEDPSNGELGSSFLFLLLRHPLFQELEVPATAGKLWQPSRALRAYLFLPLTLRSTRFRLRRGLVVQLGDQPLRGDEAIAREDQSGDFVPIGAAFDDERDPSEAADVVGVEVARVPEQFALSRLADLAADAALAGLLAVADEDFSLDAEVGMAPSERLGRAWQRKAEFAKAGEDGVGFAFVGHVKSSSYPMPQGGYVSKPRVPASAGTLGPQVSCILNPNGVAALIDTTPLGLFLGIGLIFPG